MKQLGGNPDWWRGAVIYQIYPRSFQDSTGDGVGDLAGITARLAHVADLGADAIWISPFFTSPMKDYGYDVSDYCDVDPMFGTLADFDALIDRAHDLGLRVMIDQVLSHTSDQHPWFAESRTDTANPRADWYIWADPKPDGTPPNNWLSIFGGPAWTWDGARLQYYMHNFLSSQPDLNFHNPEVQAALLDTCRFWLDRGVDGFRLDTINFYVHGQSLADNPPLALEDRNATTAPAVNPYNWQDHRHDKSQPENVLFLEKLRALMDTYPATAAVGEVGDAQRAMQIMQDYTAGGGRVHMCYSFELLSLTSLNGLEIAGYMNDLAREAPDAWPCWAYSNHDVERHGSRVKTDADGLKLLTTLMMCLRGAACIYQGEELGLGEADIAYEDLRDPYGIRFWPEFKGRDGCRTPMVWASNQPNGGFSAAKPWLPVPADHLASAVDAQSGDDRSFLAHYRAALRLRKDYPALAEGAFALVEASEEVLSFERIGHGGTRLFCAFNFAGSGRDMTLPSGGWAPVEGTGTPSAGTVSVPARSFFMAQAVLPENRV